MSSKIIVRHCSPTLAGMKMGNLFTYKFQSEIQLLAELDEWNSIFNKRGIFFVALRKNSGIALIYVYRKKQLEKELGKKEIIRLLEESGYFTESIEKCLEYLSKKLTIGNDFPHEIGVFLGYPLRDIKAFIKNKGHGFKFVGCWKVYTDKCEAKKTFEKYKKCTDIYCKKHAEGFDVTRLTVVV
ncbi:DUF3793 family protein [Sedimentibacter sp. zth1]|uniref:DUF3793 family protein n=1 Tax=Sedimentibacter sp. zth1 TaxID=2816908 RepID=UPI001A92DB7F|nr:DUF3793 family protein [Sedimentibacter sp. zth1]QSX06921.1 DUF3793 family protein [Sedimentibacter sp. zth1]